MVVTQEFKNSLEELIEDHEIDLQLDMSSEEVVEYIIELLEIESERKAALV